MVFPLLSPFSFCFIADEATSESESAELTVFYTLNYELRIVS